MFKIKGHGVQLSLDVGRYTKTLDATMDVQMRQAARAWLRAVIPRIPVYSGAARTTFKPIGRYLNVAIPISPVAVMKKRPPNSTFRFTKTKNHKYTFSFNNHLFYITLNNYFDMSGHLPLINPTPWKAFEAGEQAFMEYVQNVMPGKLPNVSKYLTSGKITIR